jgi:hypothetical protein
MILYHNKMKNQNDARKNNSVKEQKTLHGIHACDLATQDVDKLESNAWLTAGALFPELDL